MKHYRLHAIEKGRGEPVVLLHGILGSARYWESILESLRTSNRVIALDLLGYGESPKPKQSQYTAEDQIGSIRSTLHDLGISEPYTLVGHSMGALIAIRLAVDNPNEVKSLVLFGMPVYANKEEARKEIVESGIVPGYMVYGPVARITCSAMCAFRPLVQRLVPMYRKDLPRHIVEDSVKHTWYSYSRSMEHVIENQDVHKDLAAITRPVMLVYGKSDGLVYKHRIEKLRELNDLVAVKVETGSHHFPVEHPALATKYITESAKM